MTIGLLAATDHEGFRIGLAATTAGFGFRHGIDWDHIAAITDITSSQPSARRSMGMATLYAVGHGAVVLLLGILAIGFSARLPRSIDGSMERIVGVTLVALGIYVLWSLAANGRAFRMRSRWMLVFAAAARVVQRLRRSDAVTVVHDHDHDHAEHHAHHAAIDHRAIAVAAATGPMADPSPGAAHHAHPHVHIAPMPVDPFVTYGRATSVGVGMLHGIGAETPTQILLFLAAASTGGTGS